MKVRTSLEVLMTCLKRLLMKKNKSWSSKINTMGRTTFMAKGSIRTVTHMTTKPEVHNLWPESMLAHKETKVSINSRHLLMKRSTSWA